MTRLNLGGGINPVDGFDNLDKTTGWLFEDGLGDYADNTVEAITESHALMYVNLDDWPHVFSECHRVLQPGGVLRVTEDAIGCAGSNRPSIRPNAQVATNPALVLTHMFAAGFDAAQVSEHETWFVDRTLIQRNYGDEPDVFHMEGVKP